MAALDCVLARLLESEHVVEGCCLVDTAEWSTDQFGDGLDAATVQEATVLLLGKVKKRQDRGTLAVGRVLGEDVADLLLILELKLALGKSRSVNGVGEERAEARLHSRDRQHKCGTF